MRRISANNVLRTTRRIMIPSGRVSVPGEITVNAVDLDGTNDFATRGANLTGIANGTTTLVSCWFRVDGGSGTVRVIFNDKAVVVTYFLELDTSNRLEFGSRDSSGALIFHLRTTQAFPVSTQWHHFIGSFDSNSGTAQMYIDDYSDINVVTDNRPFTIPYSTRTDWVFGAYNTGSFKWNGAVSEMWFGANQILDLSVTANRRKFISANRLPMDLGTTGATPTLTQPTVYFNGIGDAFVNPNKGSGGNFTVTGSFDVASSAPSTFQAKAADFDGSTMWLTRGANLTGIADSSVLSFSVWFRRDATGGVDVIFDDKALVVRLFIEFTAGNAIEFGVRDAAGTSIFYGTTTTTFGASATWQHVCGSLNSTTGALTLYVNDVTDGGITLNQTPFTIPYSTTMTDWVIGAYNTGTLLLNGCLSDLWVSTSEYVDFSVTATRRKFITAGLKPVYLGATGELPTGTSPIVYCNNHAFTFGTNNGTGGNFTAAATLLEATTSPSD